MRTARQRRGAKAEDEALAYIESLGWRAIARNLVIERDEVDILAIDPGPPRTLVVVEVRSLRTSAFGAPEERVDRRKVARLYRAMAHVGATLESDSEGGDLPRRVDLIVVDRRSWPTRIRHLRALEPP